MEQNWLINPLKIMNQKLLTNHELLIAIHKKK